MKEAEHFTFDDRAGFSAAVLRVLPLCRHAIALVDPDLSDWPFEQRDTADALRAALLRGARLRLLLADPDWLERRGTRFMRLRREHAARIECRAMPTTLHVTESALVADGQHLVRRVFHEGFRGAASIASPSAAEPVRERFDAAWDESEPCLPATVLGL